MKLTIKSLLQSTFIVDIEPEKTVKELKDQIEKEQGKDYPSGSQKLIYSGKILADENKLSEYQFDEKKFVVLMITRPPPAPKQAPETSTESKSKPNEEKLKSTAVPPNPSSATIPNPPSTATPQNQSSVPSAPTTTASPTQEARRQQRPQTSSIRSTPPNNSSIPFGEPQMASRLASLMSQPHFRQIQDVIQQSPHLLSSTIESLAASDPEMYSFISENPDVFVSVLNHPQLTGGRRTDTTQGTTTPNQQANRVQHSAPNAPIAASGRQRPAVHQIEVSEHDKEAIERLKELGFSEYLVVQAYMACNKDEQLAANLLFQMDQ